VITSSRYARWVWTDFLRVTQDSNKLAAEKKNCSTRLRMSGDALPARMGGSVGCLFGASAAPVEVAIGVCRLSLANLSGINPSKIFGILSGYGRTGRSHG